MRTPGTYIGFFQKDSMNPPYYWNFYPVAKLLGTKYEIDFPYSDSFYRGRLQLKQENTRYGTRTLTNIQISKIENAVEEVLQKVTFDESLFKNDNYNFYNRIELPEDRQIEEAIRVEEFTLSEFLGGNVSVLLDPSDLSFANNYGAFILANFSERGESGLFGGSANEIPYSFLSEDGNIVTTGVTPKVMALFENEPAFFPDTEFEVYDANNSNIEFINIPIYANKWNSDWSGGYYEDVEYLKFIRIKDAEPIGTSHLVWNRADRKCMLEQSNPAKNKHSDSQKAIATAIPPLVEPTDNLVKRIHEYLTDSGRVISEVDVINYCICITQGFITTFAGAPGTGKTSLCRLLAKALGLQEKEEIADDDSSIPRYTEVSVERGWTSLKDFIGYPDPFAPEGADTIIPSNVDIYEAFLRMDHESRDAAGCDTLPPDLVLLDEANLSPIEYYWSQFLRNCQLDDEDELKKRKIQVSRKKAWLLSPNLRFLATVNFDHTTEELSPRFLDRTWVVTLEPPKTIGKSHRPSLPKSVNMETLQELFGFPCAEESFPAETTSTWELICEAFRNEAVNLPLSPRNINAVENFCIAASRFDEISAIQALDLAVLQKLLPTISGYGDRYDELTDTLLRIADENHLEKTSKKLKAMRDAAEQNSSFYQFFIR